ncbi:MAG: GNAT family N-acetyltransferase, partial [Acidobacteriota bacterium]|nr:GNAT family N-acetyltransferase [Acidobacteriota bacterium]
MAALDPPPAQDLPELKAALRWLPAAPARLWVPQASRPTVAILEAKGYRVLEQETLPPGASCDGAVVEAKSLLSSQDRTLQDGATQDEALPEQDSEESSPEGPISEPPSSEDRSLRLREALTAPGVVVVVGASGEPGARCLDVLTRSATVLAEAGFAVRERPAPGESGDILLVARPTPFRIRSYRPGDEERILELFADSFHHRRPEEHWRWEYRENPLGGPFISLAVDEGDTLAAHYAGYPVRFRRAEGDHRPAESFTAYQIGDTMTAATLRHVGRGPTSLLARTARHFYGRQCADRVAFNFGFNVGNIQKFSMRFLRAEKVEAIPFWRLDGAALARAAQVPSRSLWRRWLGWAGSDYRTEPSRQLDSRWDVLFDTAADCFGLLAERRSENLTWRYLRRPGFEYQILSAFHRQELVAWGVFQRRDDVLRWGDALAHPNHPAALASILRAALTSPVGEGVHAVEGWFSE